MCSVMMLSSLMRKLLKFIFSVFRNQKKKIISDTGAFEFAKRFCVKGGRVDLYAMAAGYLLAYHHPYGGYM